jgi:hypothetical protein
MQFRNPDLESRALAAYFRYPGASTPDQPASALTELLERAGRKYVVLANRHGVLAVYQVRRSTGALTRLQEVPSWAEPADAEVMS